MGPERAARLDLEKVVHNEKEKIKELLAQQETLKNQIAAGEASVSISYQVENRVVELENWVSTQVLGTSMYLFLKYFTSNYLQRPCMEHEQPNLQRQ